jgi:hypothetical protein
MASKDTLLAELNWVTEKISSQIWTVNLGTLGTTWSLLITAGLPERFKFTIEDVRWILLLGLVALLCELGQYLSTYCMYRHILAGMEKDNKTEFQYDSSSVLYLARMTFFNVKILLTIAASLFLVWTIFWKVA